MSILLLNIETTTKNCSVSLSKDGKLIAIKELNDGKYSHAENLHPFIEDILNEVSCNFSDLNAVAVSRGPGSYTGLRIGVSAAKGLCFALDIPLIATDTLEALAKTVIEKEGVIIPVLDARRMEVYQAVFSYDYKRIETTKAQIIEEATYDSFLSKGKVYFVGDAVEKCQKIIKHPNAFFVAGKFPSAKEMTSLSYQKFLNSDFEDVAYYEPYYLKDFIAVKSTKRLF
jgi:tRNA threonylcarbamoyladenosine biosynthesis protein TsaB